MWKANGNNKKAMEQLQKALEIFKDLNIEKKIKNVYAELENIKIEKF
jgi:hypothetical protein